MFDGKRVYAFILAAGSSERFGMDIPKQYVRISGKTVLEHTLEVFENNEFIDEIYLIVNPQHRDLVEEIMVRNFFKKVSKILNGGKTRQESTKVAISALEDLDSYVLVHDAVRPFVSHRIINAVLDKLKEFESVDVAIPATDTIIKVSQNLISEVPNRHELMLGQTPQGFRAGVLKKAYEIFDRNPIAATDDCTLVLKYNLGRVYVVEGERFNIKITYPEDLYLVDKIFQVRTAGVTNLETADLRSLKEKVLVVFGGNTGIGLKICELAQKYGAKAYAFSRRNACDVSSPDDVRKALREVNDREGKIDFVVDSAAVLSLSTLDSSSYDSILTQIMTNYFGAIVIAKESFPFLQKTKGALLLFASSSYTRGRKLYSIYSSTKAALVNLAQALSEEWAVHNCRVNVINPERTNTELRRKNFGLEDPSSLLDPHVVAEVALKVLLSNFTGQVIDIRKQDYF
ncbi:2-C-methyl-D-erythritol 4-phosphate cytidylyltransferase [Fervidobacterium thailandense]|uniref:2-C-methyl-D-erythritol 4-phosphate cytidylyltransferase n=1 Tax=Fervidobacterium thailandense TaxID=1008305 RepID=A0A1E3G0Q9_9BACT|nr:2-C-methyl-D-erythritol 4-phosphate cytidylyltransferase [Fervidobacterium thailandense]ODN29812.1 hypothetical protein A4H02_08645 [Fervidobacterium thailandense]